VGAAACRAARGAAAQHRRRRSAAVMAVRGSPSKAQCLCAVCMVAAALIHTARADFAAPKYVIDLARPPEDRWTEVMEAQLALHGWEHTFGPVLDYIAAIVPTEDWIRYDLELQLVAEPIVGEEMTRELRGIHRVAVQLGHRVTVSELLFFQIFYEILMQCTGVLAAGGPDREHTVWHGRNMDIGLTVANITAQVSWTRAGEQLLETTQFLGYVGVHTGMRIGGWSVEANERVVLSPGPVIGCASLLRVARVCARRATILPRKAHGMMTLGGAHVADKNATLLLTAQAFAEGHETVGGFLRSILLRASTFEEALPLLEDTPLASPMYLIVGGIDNSAVITRDRLGPANVSQDTSVLGRQPVPPGAAVATLHDRVSGISTGSSAR
jgi:hypothetical protein